MSYSPDEVMQFIEEEDVKFIKLAFCDVFGKQKNISIMSHQIEKAFKYGIAIDISAVSGFGEKIYSDLLLHPDPSTIAVLPWRPEHGRVVRMFCDITYSDGRPFEADSRRVLKAAAEEAKKEGYHFTFGTDAEFYLFKQDDNGEVTNIPYDNAGYMDIAPLDKGENVRREICLTLEQMGIKPENSHHEEGPGQNEIDFKSAAPLAAADNIITFKSVVNAIAAGNGLCADFSPKPLDNQPGNGMHINITVKSDSNEDTEPYVISGILEHIPEMTIFLNPSKESYRRFGNNKAPKYISWSKENRYQLVRTPAAESEYRYVELRSPDPICNPYLCFALIIYAGLEGIRNKMRLPDPSDVNFLTAPFEELKDYSKLPGSIKEAVSIAKGSNFIEKYLPEMMYKSYYNRL